MVRSLPPLVLVSALVLLFPPALSFTSPPAVHRSSPLGPTTTRRRRASPSPSRLRAAADNQPIGASPEVSLLKNAFYADVSSSATVDDMGLIHELPLWRVQWSELPGFQVSWEGAPPASPSTTTTAAALLPPPCPRP